MTELVPFDDGDETSEIVSQDESANRIATKDSPEMSRNMRTVWNVFWNGSFSSWGKYTTWSGKCVANLLKAIMDPSRTPLLNVACSLSASSSSSSSNRCRSNHDIFVSLRGRCLAHRPKFKSNRSTKKPPKSQVRHLLIRVRHNIWDNGISIFNFPWKILRIEWQSQQLDTGRRDAVSNFVASHSVWNFCLLALQFWCSLYAYLDAARKSFATHPTNTDIYPENLFVEVRTWRGRLLQVLTGSSDVSRFWLRLLYNVVSEMLVVILLQQQLVNLQQK